jgi:AcrR family transcriptional regulator
MQYATTTTMASATAEAASDGRVRRGERSGQAILEALIELVGEGILEPTAQQVAARAGVGMRTVFRRFSDMESLLAQMGARIEAESLPLLLGGAPRGDLADRARGLVRQRVLFFERIAPYKRAGNVKRWRSAVVRARHARLVRALHEDLVRWLPELGRAPAAVADGIDLATSFEAWDRLRTEQGLKRERAHAAVERAVLCLLGELAP